MKNINNNTFASTSKFSYTESKITKANVSSHILMLDMFFHFISFITKYSNGIQSFYLYLFFFFCIFRFSAAIVCICLPTWIAANRTNGPKKGERRKERTGQRAREREREINVGCTLSCVLYTQKTCKMPVSLSSGGFSQFTRFKRKENALEFNFNLICCTKINVRRCQRIHWNR